MNTTFKFGGRSIPLRRAIALGLADAAGNALTPEIDSAGAKVLAKEQRDAQWKKRQGLQKPTTGGRTEIAGGDPATTADGVIKRRRAPKPLVPQNVTPDGAPITDEETLAEIAAKTAAIEAANAAEVDASDAAIGDLPALDDEPESAAEPESVAGGD